MASHRKVEVLLPEKAKSIESTIPVFILGRGSKTCRLTLKWDPGFGGGYKIGACPREKEKKYIFESQVEMRATMLSLKLLSCVQNPEAH